MLDGSDPMGLCAVILDRPGPEDIGAVFDGGELLKSAFVSIDGYKSLTVRST